MEILKMTRKIREFEPTGWRVLVKPDPVLKETKSGIVLAVHEKLERSAVHQGTILKVGPGAWQDYKATKGEPWAKVGDRVLFSKYGGSALDDGSEDGLVLVNDEDIQAVITKEEEVDE